MAIVKKNKENKGYFNSYILNRIKNNKNFICCITGGTGSGKSYSAIRLGEVLDPDFSIENICFNEKEFLGLINGRTKQLKKGSVIVFDEIQVSMSHLEYQSIQARLLNYVLQTFRHRNFILFMTSPHFSFINASVRKLFHSRMETISIDINKKRVSLKPFLLQVNQDTGNVYRKYLRVWRKEFGVTPIRIMKVGLPSADMIKLYEEKKDEFTSNLNRSIENDLDKIDNPKERKPLTERQSGICEDLISGMLIPEIADKNKISENVIYFHMGAIKRKGYDIIPVKEREKVIRYDIVGFEKF